jgi:hypothetical protein
VLVRLWILDFPFADSARGHPLECWRGILPYQVEERPMPEANLEQRMTKLEEAVRELQEAMLARKPAPD